MAAHARLKNVFTEDEKYHNLMIWLHLHYDEIRGDFLGHLNAYAGMSPVSIVVRNETETNDVWRLFKM